MFTIKHFLNTLHARKNLFVAAIPFHHNFFELQKFLSKDLLTHRILLQIAMAGQLLATAYFEALIPWAHLLLKPLVP